MYPGSRRARSRRLPPTSFSGSSPYDVDDSSNESTPRESQAAAPRPRTMASGRSRASASAPSLGHKVMLATRPQDLPAVRLDLGPPEASKQPQERFRSTAPAGFPSGPQAVTIQEKLELMRRMKKATDKTRHLRTHPVNQANMDIKTSSYKLAIERPVQMANNPMWSSELRTLEALQRQRLNFERRLTAPNGVILPDQGFLVKLH
eukprot:TRINITY_DN12020_c0_g1_i2.p1 TRINITY_DN12020_c0_g1~~TRINITY_DN12020_c0_g1_i2.p1  ORF type:complete len:224 (+),score=23.42 TRINITY_DN12020_c0_g1_i2:60-674(+)